MVKSYALGALGVIAVALLASSFADSYADSATARAPAAAREEASALPSEIASDGSEPEAAPVVEDAREVLLDQPNRAY